MPQRGWATHRLKGRAFQASPDAVGARLIDSMIAELQSPKQDAARRLYQLTIRLSAHLNSEIPEFLAGPMKRGGVRLVGS